MELLVSLLVAVVVAVIAVPAIARLVRVTTVYEYQRALVYDRGRFVGVTGPGRYWLFGRRKTFHLVDTRPMQVSIGGQEVVSADGVSVRLSMAVEYALAEPAVAINDVENYYDALHVAAQLALRQIVGSTPIEELLERRDEVGAQLSDLVRPRALELGLELRRIDLKDVTFPGDLKRTFAQVVAARKEGQAALERARGETAALRNLANAARMMDANPGLLQLRLIQQLGTAGGNTIVLGLPSSTTPLPLRGESAEPPELSSETE